MSCRIVPNMVTHYTIL